jgi:hypothetical protein
MTSSDCLIHLSNVKKVFYTDEVETHALSGIDLDIKHLRQLNSVIDSGFARHTERW